MEEKEYISSRKKDFLIGLLITFIVTGAITGIIILLEVTSLGKTWKSDGYLILINSFTISSIFVELYALLVLVSNEGAFDAITYGVKLAFYVTFFKETRKTKLAKNYTEYRELKRGKRKNHISFIFLGALPYLLAGIITMIPYYTFIR